MDIDPQDEYERLGGSYERFARLLDAPDAALHRRATAISAWSPAQHLHHILIANGMMLKGIALICAGGSRILPEGALNDDGRYVLTHEHFPRGRGQAPAPTRPPADPSRADLRQGLARSQSRYEAAAKILPQVAGARGYLPHLFLGELDALQWLRLARVHSEHHLAIIDEILAHDAA